MWPWPRLDSKIGLRGPRLAKLTLESARDGCHTSGPNFKNHRLEFGLLAFSSALGLSGSLARKRLHVQLFQAELAACSGYGA